MNLLHIREQVQFRVPNKDPYTLFRIYRRIVN